MRTPGLARVVFFALSFLASWLISMAGAATRLSDAQILSRLHAKTKKLPDGRYELHYDFSDVIQSRDWRIINEGARWGMIRGKLIQLTNATTSRDCFAAQFVSKVDFIGDVELEAEFIPVDNDKHGLCICFAHPEQNYSFEMNADWGSE
jgi:hypothetical protein